LRNDATNPSSFLLDSLRLRMRVFTLLCSRLAMDFVVWMLPDRNPDQANSALWKYCAHSGIYHIHIILLPG
jgi:hypothetical protein